MDRRNFLILIPITIGIVLIAAGIIITFDLTGGGTQAPEDTGAQSACRHISTQVRVKTLGQTPWESELTIECGEQFEVGSFHNNTGVYATDTSLSISGPGVNRVIANGDKVTTAEPGTYTLNVTTNGGSGGACTGMAKVTCTPPLPKYDCEDIYVNWSYGNYSQGKSEVNWVGELERNGTPSCELKVPMESGATNPGPWQLRVYRNAIGPDPDNYETAATYNRGPFKNKVNTAPATNTAVEFYTVACVEVDIELVPGVTDQESPRGLKVCNPVKVLPALPVTVAPPRPATPRPPVLPRTGIDNNALKYAAGTSLMLLGGVLYLRYRKLH